MTRFLFNLFYFIFRVLGKLSRWAMLLAEKWAPRDLQGREVIRSTRYDMVFSPNEPYYAEQYMRVIRPYLEFLPLDARILDLGCSQGRFSILFAEYFHAGHVTGCDLSENSIDQAREYASSNHVTNAEFQVQSITDCLYATEANSADLILLTEVTFFYPDWRGDFPNIIRALKPGGLLIASFRSQYFDALCIVRSRLWDSVDQVLNERQGNIHGTLTVYSWQTSREIANLLQKEHGLELLELTGIGTCSGIPGDPHDSIVEPAQLSDQEREYLLKLELKLGKSVPDGGRYILAVARKPSNQGLNQ